MSSGSLYTPPYVILRIWEADEISRVLGVGPQVTGCLCIHIFKCLSGLRYRRTPEELGGSFLRRSMWQSAAFDACFWQRNLNQQIDEENSLQSKGAF